LFSSLGVCRHKFSLVFVSILTVLIYLPWTECFAQTIYKPTPVPIGQLNIVGELKRYGVFEVFLSALDQSNLTALLEKGQGYTVFAPTDAGFANVNGINKQELFADKKLLKEFLEQHIIEGVFLVNQLELQENIVSVSGQQLMIEHKKPPTIAQARIVRPDLLANNGVIHALGSARLVQK
jgi:uncharacterized surface protein with fasciclin (FAS1) repeats